MHGVHEDLLLHGVVNVHCAIFEVMLVIFIHIISSAKQLQCATNERLETMVIYQLRTLKITSRKTLLPILNPIKARIGNWVEIRTCRNCTLFNHIVHCRRIPWIRFFKYTIY